jgi:hypothetical protein
MLWVVRTSFCLVRSRIHLHSVITPAVTPLLSVARATYSQPFARSIEVASRKAEKDLYRLTAVVSDETVS